MLNVYTLKGINKKYFKKRKFRYKILYDRFVIEIYFFLLLVKKIVNETAMKTMSSDICRIVY